MTGQFVLSDRSHVLVPEEFPTFHDALTRAGTQPWIGTPWAIVDPAGHVAATPSVRKENPDVRQDPAPSAR